jgi:Tfp pilus assembly protein PilN
MRLPILQLGLAAHGLPVVRAAQWGLACIIAGSAAVAGWLWWDSQALDEQAAVYEAAARRVQSATSRFVEESLQAGVDLSEGRLKAMSQEVAFSDQLLKQRAFSWTRFLSDLEDAVPPRISIASVKLSEADAAIALSGSALALKDITALVNSLERHPSFRNVVLSQHRVQEPAGTEEEKRKMRPTVEFTMTAAYRPAL